MTVVVEGAHRLARDLIVSELAIQEARAGGIIILDAASGEDLTQSGDPTRVLIRQVLGALSQWDKSIMVKRLRDARVRKKARGERCEGRIPFGNRSETDAETWALMVGWRRAGWSYGDIQRELNRIGRRTPQGHSNHWYRSVVAKMLKQHDEKNKPAANPKPELLEGLGV